MNVKPLRKRADKVIVVRYVKKYEFLKGDFRSGYTFTEGEHERFFIPAVSKLWSNLPANFLVTMVNLSSEGYKFMWPKASSKKYK